MQGYSYWKCCAIDYLVHVEGGARGCWKQQHHTKNRQNCKIIPKFANNCNSKICETAKPQNTLFMNEKLHQK